MAEISWQVALVIGLGAFGGALAQSVVGLGMGLLAAPVAALVAPDLVPVLPLWMGLTISGLMLAGERHDIEWRAIAWALPARVPGTVLGAWLAASFTEQQIGVVLGVLVLVAVALTLRTFVIPKQPATLVTAGFVAGVSGTATSVAGPPMALVFQRERPEVVRATLSVFFFGGVMFSLTALALSGQLDLATTELAVAYVPVVVAGLLAGRVLRHRLPRGAFRTAVLLACTASAVALLVRSLF